MKTSKSKKISRKEIEIQGSMKLVTTGKKRKCAITPSDGSAAPKYNKKNIAGNRTSYLRVTEGTKVSYYKISDFWYDASGATTDVAHARYTLNGVIVEVDVVCMFDMLYTAAFGM